jgi:hypothetical protein
MKDIKSKIYNVLSSDTTLVNMLGLNKPFNNPAGTAAKKNSVMPAFVATGQTVTPFLTIQGGPETIISDRFYTSVVYVKIYNQTNKTFVSIDEIVSRVVSLLHLQQLGLSEGVQVKMVRESVSAEFQDEGLKMNFKEITFRVYML